MCGCAVVVVTGDGLDLENKREKRILSIPLSIFALIGNTFQPILFHFVDPSLACCPFSLSTLGTASTFKVEKISVSRAAGILFTANLGSERGANGKCLH